MVSFTCPNATLPSSTPCLASEPYCPSPSWTLLMSARRRRYYHFAMQVFPSLFCGLQEMMKHKNRSSKMEDMGVVLKTSDGQVLVFKNLVPNRNLVRRVRPRFPLSFAQFESGSHRPHCAAHLLHHEGQEQNLSHPLAAGRAEGSAQTGRE